MTRRFVGPMIAALACTVFVAACEKGPAPPSKACVEAARLYAEALDQNSRAPAEEKADKMAARKAAITALEENKVSACGE